MDSLLSAAGRALTLGDPLRALNHVALRDDPPALALRAIAMAQLSDYPRARALLRRAARGFGAHEAVARARCIVAEAEVALAMRELARPVRAVLDAAELLDRHRDHANAALARLIAARQQLLLGRLAAARGLLATLDRAALPDALQATWVLLHAELALRVLDTTGAQAHLAVATAAALRSGIAGLQAEVERVRSALQLTAARSLRAGHEQPLRLEQVQALLASSAVVVDACRHGLQADGHWQPLARRPVLFALLRALAESWPGDVERNVLIARVFRTRQPDETHRARLRVELGRLRALLPAGVTLQATASGFALLSPQHAIIVLVPPVDSEQGEILALLADGMAWSTSSLAMALGASQRTVQRALGELAQAGQARAVGRARAQRWLAAPLIGFTTALLLPPAWSAA
ncbi:MAG TPA: helix-turn-helix domain-containing protein [Stenotrophomonas sp.]|nr:helix-turn-helix domain-containing protein [Stenotrophomonas sp.]